jgi:lysyl-tRNA synthetase class 2
MSWEPEATLDLLKMRAQLNGQIHAYFQARNVTEVETPILNQFAVTDLQIDSIATESSKYLHTSPEYAMKRLLAFHKCDIYQLCKVFRANEKGRYHNNEFTLLEWYRVGWSYKDLMKEVAELITVLASNYISLHDVTYISYQDIFKQYASINVQTANQADFLQICGNYSIKLNSSLTTFQYQELILDQIIVPKLEKRHMTFIYNYPAEQSALAKLNDQGHAERFELYLDGIELANGFQELTDAQEQFSRFEEDNRQRLLVNKKAIKVDTDFIAALESGLPESAGVALGIDRLLMIMSGAKHINEVLSFSIT